MKKENNIVFREQWYKLISKNLTEDEQKFFYSNLFAFIFSNDEIAHERLKNHQGSRILLDMIIEQLQDDKEKYKEKCEKYRQNSLAKNNTNGNQSLPMATDGYPLANNINNNINNNLNNFSLSKESPKTETEREEEDKKIFITLYKRGAIAPLEEYEKFNTYYSSIGWVTAKGLPIKDKTKVAQLWKISNVITEEEIIQARQKIGAQLLNNAQNLTKREIVLLTKNMYLKTYKNGAIGFTYNLNLFDDLKPVFAKLGINIEQKEPTNQQLKQQPTAPPSQEQIDRIKNKIKNIGKSI